MTPTGYQDYPQHDHASGMLSRVANIEGLTEYTTEGPANGWHGLILPAAWGAMG